MKATVEERADRLWRRQERRYWPNGRIPDGFAASKFQRDMTRADVAWHDAMRELQRAFAPVLRWLREAAERLQEALG